MPTESEVEARRDALLRQEVGRKILRRMSDEQVPKLDGDYDCCGCSTYRTILEDSARIVRDETGFDGHVV